MNNAPVDKNEINLREMFKVIWKRKFWIAGIVALTCAVTVFILLKMDNIYESKAVLRPSQNNTNQMSSIASNLGGLANLAGISIGSGGDVSPYNAMNAIVKDNDFIYSFVTANKLEPKLIEDFSKVSATEAYKKNPKYFIARSFRKNFSFSQDAKTGLVSVSYLNKDREFAKKFVDAFLRALNLKYKEIEMKNLQERIENYKNEIDKTNDITLKNKLAEVVSGLIQNKVLAQAQEFFGFDVLVKAGIPDVMDKVKPKRGMILIAVAFLSLLLSVVTVLIIESIRTDLESLK